ncbi:MAG: hypothetical protein H0Z28_10990 [Archaeoglobus sp.]|nr:hypothetical protein [Archaeoglobus sp.]
MVKHPSILQFRDAKGWKKNLKKNLEKSLVKSLEKQILNYLERKSMEYAIEETKNGFDLYLSDVNDARKLISALRKRFTLSIKMSTKYAGLRKGRVRVLFVYSIRIRDDGI